MNLSAVIGLQSLGLGSFANSGSKLFSVGPALSLPLFDGGRLRANLASQDAAYDLAVEQYNQTLVDALHDIADQLASIRWLAPRLNEQQRTVDTAEEAFRLVEQRYAAGLATYIQVLSAQAVVSTQRRDLTDLQARGLGLQASLARALGGGYRPESFEGGSALN
jgi:outer membrane protein TolC